MDRKWNIFAARPWPDGTMKYAPIFDHIGSWEGYVRIRHIIITTTGYLLPMDNETRHTVAGQIADVESKIWDHVIRQCEAGTAVLGYAAMPIELPSDPVLLLYITVVKEHRSWKEVWELRRK